MAPVLVEEVDSMELAAMFYGMLEASISLMHMCPRNVNNVRHAEMKA